MGVLDDLRKQSAEQRAREEAARQREQEQQAFYQQEIRPRLEQVYTYLNELAEQLNYIKPDLKFTYELPGGTQLASLKQENYSMEADSRDNMQQIAFRFYCQAPGEVIFRVEGKKTYDKLNEFMHQCRLRYKTSQIKDDMHNVVAAELNVENIVPIVFQFNADIENGNIILWIRNFEKLGIRKIMLLPRQVNEAMLDDLGKYIVREVERFMQLEIDDQSKKELQERIRQEQIRREIELKVIEQMRQEEEQKELENKLLFKIKKQAQDVIEKAKKRK